MDRRTLIQLLGGASLLPMLPGIMLPGTVQAGNWQDAGTSGRRVIMLELSGANDSLNTTVPYRDDRYHEMRPTIGLKGNSLITLNDHFAFNAAFKELMPLWETGEMAVVHGLGYPTPNRSHFKSIALWETGGDGNKARRTGWLTHDIEHAYATSQIDAHGISLGGGMGLFESPGGNWLTMRTANQFADREVAAPSVTGKQRNTMMNALLEQAQTLNNSIERIANKVDNNRHPVRISSGNKLLLQMAHAINLINADVDAPFLKVSLSGFDTHENQKGRHSNLLRQMAASVLRLRDELIKTDNWNNTIVVTYSEFGRRAAQNRSNGTDHGAAASHFVFGGGINGGFHGQHPDLGNLQQGDLRHTMDYRALYSSVLSDWLNLPTNAFSEYETAEIQTLFG